MKKIALIMDGWKRFFTYAWPAGILQRIQETGEEVNLYIFNSSGNWSRDAEYNEGEYNIFNLPDLKEFDGAVIDLNNILQKDVRERIVERLRKANIPVISIANEYPEFYFVGINNYTAIQEIMIHLVKQHGCRKFWFVMGADDNYENVQRVKGIQDYLTSQRIPWTETDFYYGSYEFYCGGEGVRHFLARGETLPDAIVCANDNIAVGVCSELEKHGYRVPEDTRITGFDNFDKAGYYEPRITTTGHIREEVGYLCADTLLALWNGKQPEHFQYTQAHPVYQESCGCEKARDYRAERNHLKNEILYGIETTSFDEAILNLEYEFLKCNSFREMIDCIPHCIPAMNCEAMYLILDKRVNNFQTQSNIYDQGFLNHEDLCEVGYPKEMAVEFAYENGRMIDSVYRKITDLFPMFDTQESGVDFLFIPLHFRNLTIGYFVIRKAVYLMEKQYLFQVVNSLMSAMENLHKKEKLNYMNQILSELYVRDAMTMLYNRSGYRKLAEDLLREKKRQGQELLVLFIDLDCLKMINDNYGHKIGDIAIKSVANALLHCCSVSGIPIRLGGDEFLLIDEIKEDTGIEQLIDNVRTEVRENGKKLGCPVNLDISAGMVVTDLQSDRTVEEYVTAADAKMYEEKSKKKNHR